VKLFLEIYKVVVLEDRDIRGRYMDKTLLKRTAIQCLALMIAVISFSYALKQHQAVTIAAVNLSNEEGLSSTVNTLQEINLSNSNQEDIPKEELTYEQKLVDGVDKNILEKLGDNFLVIKKPQGNDLKLQHEDLYINKSIQLTITGITTDKLMNDMLSRVFGDEVFYGEPKYTESTSIEVDEEDGSEKEVVTRDYGNDLCHGITITTQQDTKTKQYTAQVLIELNSVYAYILYEDANYYFIDLRKPSEVYDKIVVIDAGHGGKDVGALSKDQKYYEKNINLDILLDVEKLLEKENIKVYYTRTGDNTVFLRPRAELANEVDCDYFISIHSNANSLTSPNGTEVLFYNNEFKGVKAASLAKLFLEELSKTIALKSRGIVEKHPEDIFIMDQATVPMILIEVGYLTNQNDMNYLSQSENRKAVAQGIYNGIMKAYNELPVEKEQ
jgi:N-acetylmuramoyl-L-alanine amidase